MPCNQAVNISTARENKGWIDYDCKVGQKILAGNEGILHKAESRCRKAESRWQKDPWAITTVHANGTITIQCRNKEERLNIRRENCLKNR
jgi:hypothetical protein